MSAQAARVIEFPNSRRARQAQPVPELQELEQFPIILSHAVALGWVRPLGAGRSAMWCIGRGPQRRGGPLHPESEPTGITSKAMLMRFSSEAKGTVE